MERSGIYMAPPYQKSGSRRRLSDHRGTKLQPATLFVPNAPNLAPEVHFPLQTVSAPDRPPYPRFVNRFDSREILLVVDGSCVNNGRHGNKCEPPVAGCSFTFKGNPTSSLDPAPQPVTFPFRSTDPDFNNQVVKGTIAFRLEREGPLGQPIEHTSNRAKLRAVIAALQFRPWDAEGWRRVVILTDLEYIVSGATTWLPRWIKRGWRKRANRDLWEELQGIIEELRSRKCEVSFWLVTNEFESQFIGRTKAAARSAARTEGVEMEKFTKLCGIML